MQFETKEPVHRGFASSRQASKHLMASNPTVMAHLEAGAIDEADTGAAAKAVLQIHTQGQQNGRYPFHKAVVADEAGKCLSPMHADMLAVERLKVSIVLLVEAHQDRHDLAQTQRTLALTVLNPFTKEHLVPFRLELLAEVINRTKQFF